MNLSNDHWMINYFNVSQIRELMAGAGPGPIYGFPRHRHAHHHYHDMEPAENSEDEAAAIGRFPAIDQLLREVPRVNAVAAPPETSTPAVPAGGYSGLSGDSLAFTLVYVSVFTVTLLYVGLRLARRWRKKQQQVATQALQAPAGSRLDIAGMYISVLSETNNNPSDDQFAP